MNDWIEIFKSGTWTGTSGQQSTWTDADLDNIVAKYNPKEHEAPVVLGHPVNDAPAYGWVEALKREGGTLFAKLKQVQPAFAEMVRNGMYKKRSVAIYGDGTLRHVGFLGGAVPAVKGLADVQFSENSYQDFEFAIDQQSTAPDSGAQTSHGGEKMSEVIDVGRLERELASAKEELAQIRAKAEQQKQEAFSEMEKTNQDLQSKVNEFAEKNADLEKRLAVAEKLVAKQRQDAAKADREAFCECLVKDNKLPAGLKEKALSVLAMCDSGYQFEEGDGIEKNIRALLGELPAFEPKPIDAKQAAPVSGKASELFAEKVKEKMDGGKIDYIEAFTAVQMENPQLAIDMQNEGRV